MDINFLLKTELSRQLYFRNVRELPVIDYHNHLAVRDIAEDRSFDNLTELWIAPDPYKHRAMRICGVEEKYITGEADPFEKFQAWSDSLPKLAGNPLSHWAAMELWHVFGIETPLRKENARAVWEQANAMLRDPSFSARGLLERFHVEYAAPCCGILEDIGSFQGLKNLVPSLRGDEACSPCQTLIGRLEDACGLEITSLDRLRKAFCVRLDTFHRAGCRFADHALDQGFCYVPEDGKNQERLAKVRRGERLEPGDMQALSCAILRILGGEYARRGWIMQLHIGAMRNTSSRLRRVAGPAGGYAGIGRCPVGDIVALLDDLEKNGELPRTILFTLNPADNEAISALSGSFTEAGTPGKVQQGAAWWWCDHLRGICQVLETISAYSVLSVFYGMTTDSRSLLSFVRHDYFRRILCGWLAERAGRTGDTETEAEIGKIAERICYGNLKTFLQLSGVDGSRHRF